MKYTIGVDEVGVGSWAGPIYVCGVLTLRSFGFPGLDGVKNVRLQDSKKLSRRAHKGFYELAVKLVADGSILFEVAIVTLEQINDYGISRPMHDAKIDVVRKLRERQPSAQVVVDGILDFPDDLKVNSVAVPHADTSIPSVMLAANIAKHLRDSYMIEQASKYPNYGFERHVGYGTPQHIEALHRHGVCDLHRQTYKPVKKVLEQGTLSNDTPGIQPVSEEFYAAWRKRC